MSIRLDGPVIHLEGDCPVEEAETLLHHLQDPFARTVDWTEAERLHTAVGYPCHLRREAFDVILLFLEQALRDQEAVGRDHDHGQVTRRDGGEARIVPHAPHLARSRLTERA